MRSLSRVSSFFICLPIIVSKPCSKSKNLAMQAIRSHTRTVDDLLPSATNTFTCPFIFMSVRAPTPFPRPKNLKRGSSFRMESQFESDTLVRSCSTGFFFISERFIFGFCTVGTGTESLLSSSFSEMLGFSGNVFLYSTSSATILLSDLCFIDWASHLFRRNSALRLFSRTSCSSDFSYRFIRRPCGLGASHAQARTVTKRPDRRNALVEAG
mmetsp:Transcript_25983/g.62593  ORF Transcript_25983/g.62593 Transcript_25983/m.62593 type:complete len:212 (+) Transcript_25983:383-1018(+)